MSSRGNKVVFITRRCTIFPSKQTGALCGAAAPLNGEKIDFRKLSGRASLAQNGGSFWGPPFLKIFSSPPPLHFKNTRRGGEYVAHPPLRLFSQGSNKHLHSKAVEMLKANTKQIQSKYTGAFSDSAVRVGGFSRRGPGAPKMDPQKDPPF